MLNRNKSRRFVECVMTTGCLLKQLTKGFLVKFEHATTDDLIDDLVEWTRYFILLKGSLDGLDHLLQVVCQSNKVQNARLQIHLAEVATRVEQLVDESLHVDDLCKFFGVRVIRVGRIGNVLGTGEGHRPRGEGPNDGNFKGACRHDAPGKQT